MTIKEVEARTGLTRANIRYYEGEGFFSAARGENGYRDYSGQDVDVLLKVKLLRQLGFSLEDIRDFQRGDQELSAALLRREEGLEREQLERDHAARLCRELREDQADFATLDARRYLERMDQGRKDPVLKEDQIPRHSFILRRYFARMLDWLVWHTLVSLCYTAARYAGFAPPEFTWLPVAVTSLALMLVSETLLLHFTGATLGKRLLGLKVLREDGSFLSLSESLWRTFWVMVLFSCYVMARFYRLFGTYYVGYARAATLLGILIWRYGSDMEWIPKLTFWRVGNELYLEGSTREKSFWDREDTRGGVIAAGLIIAACFWLMAVQAQAAF